MKSNFITVSATILKKDADNLQIKIQDGEKDICLGCESRAGCKSLSISPLLIKEKVITIKNNTESSKSNNHSVGETLRLRLSSNFLSYSLIIIIGLPLSCFILGVILLSKVTTEINAFLFGLLALFVSGFIMKSVFNNIFLQKALKILKTSPKG